MKRLSRIRLAVCLLSLCLFISGTAWADPFEEEDSVISMEITNKTGSDIVFLSVEDAASYQIGDYSSLDVNNEEEPYINLLKDGGAFTEDQTRVIGFSVEIPEEMTDDAKALKDLLKGFGTDTQYIAAFQLADDERVYVLHVFLPEEAYHTEIFVEDGIAWVEYTSKGSDGVISTHEAEKAIAEMEKDKKPEEKAEPSEQEEGEPAAEGEEPYVVSQVAFPNCDDGSHGYYEITYSDGSVEYVEY